jgi:hypothetical protein
MFCASPTVTFPTLNSCAEDFGYSVAHLFYDLLFMLYGHLFYDLLFMLYGYYEIYSKILYYYYYILS